VWRNELGERAEWTVDRIIAARTLYAIEVGNWQYVCANTDKGKPTPPAPEPILPPWVQREQDAAEAGHVTESSESAKNHFGGAHMTIEEANKWLGW
jgi:hypothetical protein